MKKLLLFLFLGISVNCFSQVSITKSEVKYDTNFDPVVTITIKNETDKTITNIWMTFRFIDNRIASLPASEYVEKNVSISINPKSSKEFSVNLKTPKKDYKYSQAGLDKIRFSDGSIKK